jgi:hypothetical protein
MSLATTCCNAHKFNGGYDPSRPLTWTPEEAAEFTIFHESTPEIAGMQLRTAIQHWTGADLAEFLARLYLAQRLVPPRDYERSSSVGNKLLYEPDNVRSPQWKGLDSRAGVMALKGLLKEALSPDILDARELARFAESFLLKEYRWPYRKDKSKSIPSLRRMSKQNENSKIIFEQDSFYTQGHAKTLARILWSVRKERLGAFTWNDIVVMVTLPEKENKESTALEMTDFFRTLVARIPMTVQDKANMVRQLALGGWSPSSIPKFMANVLPAEAMDENHVISAEGCLDDSFMDFPQKREKRHDSKTEIMEKTALESVEEQFLLSSDMRNAKDTVRMEYDELVKSYWKQMDIPKAKKLRKGGSVDDTKPVPVKEMPVPSRSPVANVSIVAS